MWEAKSPWSSGMRIDETVCGVLCQHPSCWHSTNRKIKGVPHVVPSIPPPDEIETDLPTLKVNNLLDDYGEDPRDLYPSKYEGKPAHMRTSLPLPTRKNPVRNSSIRVTATPGVTPSSQTKRVTREKKEMNLVEVQEVFELEDLNSTWNDTFVSKQYYVWVPNPKKKGKKKKKSKKDDSSQNVAPSGQVMVRDITETLIPKEVEYERLNTKSTDDHDFPVLKKKRAMSPLMSGLRRTPYSKSSSYGFRSAGHGRPMFDAEGLEELLNLPRDVLIHVLNHSKSSDFSSRDRIREIIQRFLPPFERGFTDLSTESTDLLTQRKMNLHESKTRNIRQPNLMETKPVFYLDEDGVNQELTPKGPGQGMQIFDSEFGSIRDLYMSGTREFPKFKNPLPPIGDGSQENGGGKIPSISLGLPELPTGIRHTKPFNYKRNNNQFDFTLAPVPTPPTSVRDIETPGSEHGTTIRVNVPSASERPPLDVPTPVFPEEKKAPITVPAITDTQTESQQSKTTGAPLHAVSPAHSTKVPHAPATTPATQISPAKAYNRMATPPKDKPANDQQVVSRETTGLSSPKQPAPPANSPHFTPEHTGLDTIEEIRQEGTGEQQTHPVSRGGRSVRFAAEVPEVPPPPSSPQEPGDADDFDQSTLTTPIVQEMDAKPRSGISMLTAQNTFNTDREFSENELRSGRKREVSDLSTPEPWPQINEADYDTTPAPPPSSKQSMHPSESMDDNQNNLNSRAAVIDNHSDRNIDSKTITISDLESIDSKLSEKDHKKGDDRKSESPGPPPPSPEPKDPRKLTVEDPKSRKSKSRESTAMTPLPEESDQEESHDAQVRTIVVEVPPLGQPTQSKSKSRNSNRTIDTFMNVDIPAGVKENHVDVKINPLKERKLDIAPTVTEVPEEETATINTRDVDMSVQSSLGGQTSAEPESAMSDVTSAGIDQSVGGNVSPTSTLTDNRTNNIDLKLLGDLVGDISEAQETIQETQETVPGTQETVPETQETVQETEENLQETEETAPEKQEVGLEEEKTEITEDGGDHEGFKQELQEEYDKLSQETK